MGLFFGILTSLAEILIGPERQVGALVLTFAFKSAFFGCGVAGWIVRASRRAQKTDHPPPLHPVRALSLPCGMEAGLALVRAALLRIPNSSLVGSHPEIGTLVAKTGHSRKSWGEVITARVQPVGPEECAIRLESRPRMRLTLEDSGVNAKNVQIVATALHA